MTANTPLGAVIRDAEGVRLEFERTFPDPIEVVWAAITNSDQLGTWFGTWRGDPATGTIEVSMIEGDGTYKETELTTCDPPRTVAVVLTTPLGPCAISATLSETGAGAGTSTGTTLIFTHQLDESYDASTMIGPGWHYYLDRLAAVVAGDTMPEGTDWPEYEGLASSYPLPD